MAGRQVSYTKVSLAELVNKLDPKRLSTPQVVYVFDNNKAITQRPEQPGEDYPWFRDIEHD